MAFDTLNTATHQWMECILDDSANGVNDAAVAFDTLNTAAHQWMECTLDDCADGVDGGAVLGGSQTGCAPVSMDTDTDFI